MTVGALVVLLITSLAASAVAGPWVLRHAAPALARVPRAAVVLLAGSVLGWLCTALALGPLLAWTMSGPSLLPDGAAETCQRCLDAANPFPTTPLDSAVPVVLLLALPALGTVALGVAITIEALRRRHATARTGRLLRDQAERRAILGYQVLVVDDPHPFAMTLPRRHGGISLSAGALDALAPDELAAVLAHEHAHLRQHHHLVTTAMASVSRYLRWVPLVAASEAALGHYLEIAADDAARRRAGTPALAGALLALGEHSHSTPANTVMDGALHMLGPDRIRHLVQPCPGTAGVLPALAATSYVTALTLLAATVHLPYLITVLTGCA
ncbi:Peptidase family M48 [Promicromonospora umidemergens]|uniref:M56 family metallopeptidase n=1 Tax=Promicromonospora umidemergens TaxID=629679 RepID=A0ABP8WFZ6_9MICO|nr:M56 family metallopeptidase [Promicromonospora umidemergens]MCP2285968.1 Peptidase family M48 [Promicromonospora umidemergens]